jgi:transketolase
VRVATIEAGITEPWKFLAGRDGLTIGIDRFGASAPAGVLAEQFGLTASSVANRIREWLG